MARSLKEAHTWLEIGLMWVLMTGHSAAYAESIPDPTRPPAALTAPSTAGGTDTASALKLQAVMITPTLRSAIINGERVELGKAYGEARVVRISEQEVELRSAEGSQTLKMYPDIAMKPSKEEAPQKAVQKNNRRRR